MLPNAKTGTPAHRPPTENNNNEMNNTDNNSKNDVTR